MQDIIRFTEEERKRVEDFAEQIKWKHPNFKDKRCKEKRTQDQVKQDVILGKLAEVAVYKYLKGLFGEDVSDIDFNLYGEGIADNYDVKVRGRIISIKASKMGSSCLLIEKEKFQVDDDGNLLQLEHKPLPDYFIFVRVNLFDDNVYAEISGSIDIKTFWRKKKFMPRGFVLNKTNAQLYLMEFKRLPDIDWNAKGTKLLADNFGVHKDGLYDLQKIFKESSSLQHS